MSLRLLLRRKLVRRCRGLSVRRLLAVVAAVNAGGAEEDDRVLNLLAAETRKRFAVLGQQAQNPAVRTVEKWFVLISEWSGLEFWISHK